MKQRLLMYLAVGAILAVLAVMVDRSYKDTNLLQQSAKELSLAAETEIADAQHWVDANQALLLQFAQRKAESDAMLGPQMEQAAKPYTILVSHRDTLFFWSNNKVVLSGWMLSELEHAPELSLLRLPVGYFALRRLSAGNATVSILTPLQYTLETAVGGAGQFPANEAISNKIRMSAEKGAMPVRIGGADLAWLDAVGNLQPLWVQALKLVAYGLLLLLFLVWIHEAALWLVKKYHPLVGLGLVLGSLAAVIYSNAHWALFDRWFGGFTLFSKSFPQLVLGGHAPGDWLVYGALILWAGIFAHQSLRSPKSAESIWGALAATVSYLVLMLSVLFCVYAFRQMVFETKLDLNFGEILQLNAGSFAAMGSVVICLAACFLLGHRLMLIVRDLFYPRARRAAYQAIGLVVFAIPAFLSASYLGVNFVYLLGFALLYALIFDFFIHIDNPGFGWVVLWLLIFSLFAAFLLNRFNNQNDQRYRESYVQRLVEPRDTSYAEPLLKDCVKQIEQDTQLPFLLKPWPFKPERDQMRQFFNSYAYYSNYLFEHYPIQVYAFDKEQQPLLLNQTGNWDQVVRKEWELGQVLDGASNVRFRTGTDGVFRYMTRFKVDRMNDPSQPVELFCFFEHNFPQPARVYAQLFYTHPFKGMERLNRYDFSLWRSGKLVAERGQGSAQAIAIPMDKGQVKEIRTKDPDRVDAVAQSADGVSLAAVGRQGNARYRLIYLFSILFTFASLVLALLALLNPFLPVLPEYFRYFISTKGSLARRIHYSTISLILIAFLVIGFMTYRHFSASARRSDEAGYNYRANAVLTQLRDKFGKAQPSDSLSFGLNEALGPLTSSLTIDANLYSPNGSILYSSRQDLVGIGLIPEKLRIETRKVLQSGGVSVYEDSESLAGHRFYTKYFPLRNNQNQLLAYLSIPYNFEGRQTDPEVSDFMGMLASLYVFLLLLAGIATFLLAQSIIKPVRLISDKIKELRFEDTNEPLEYEGDRSDELGELIQEYNRMVDKLEDSKVQLIRLEREGAWREMARQIAHDIKNPLTTMKLSMQQLERVSNDPMQAAAYLKKAITRLIEQIDSLAQIASEFSMFANLDIRQKHEMVLNDVVESVYDLFTEQKEVALELNIPKEHYVIDGDKNHLIRVFNNLVINAIQAIPEDRKGIIQVRLFLKGKDAIVQIHDNGGGIPPEIQKRVFEPNFTTKSSGSGLGLAICRRIIEALDGNIRFETRQGEGTDFFVSLPLKRVEA